MAGIDKYLDIIKKGVFGRDVRKAIHDGIAQVYEDATFDGNTNMEVAKARGTFEQLPMRLDSMSDDLANKANQKWVDSQLKNIVSSSPGSVLENFETIQNTYPNGLNKIVIAKDSGKWYYWNNSSNTWVEGGIYQAKMLGSDEVTVDNVDFVKGIKQMLSSKIDDGTWTWNGHITVYNATGWSRYMPVHLIKGKTYYIYNVRGYFSHIVSVDGARRIKQLATSDTLTTIEYTATEDSLLYISTNDTKNATSPKVFNASINELKDAQVDFSNSPNGYATVNIPKLSLDVKAEDISFANIIKQLIDESAFINGLYYTGNKTSTSEQNSWGIYPAIYLKADQTYGLQNVRGYFTYFFDNNDNLIKKFATSDVLISEDYTPTKNGYLLITRRLADPPSKLILGGVAKASLLTSLDYGESALESTIPIIGKNKKNIKFGRDIKNIDKLATITINELGYLSPKKVSHENKGFISKVNVYIKNSGAYTFAVATIDQNNLVVSPRIFTKQLKSGYNELLLRDENIPIYYGEQLFFKNSKDNLVYASVDGETNLIQDAEHMTTNPGYSGKIMYETSYSIPFNYEIEPETTEDKVHNIEAQINKIVPLVKGLEIFKQTPVVTSPNGTKFRLVVDDNGIISAVPSIPKKITFFGNSLLSHGGYYGGVGMAATSQDKDYYHLLTNYIKSKNPNAITNIGKGPNWEGGTSSAERRKMLNTLIRPMIDSDTDIVFIQFGDNVNTAEKRATFIEDGIELVNFIKSNSPKALIYWIGVWYGGKEVADFIKTICDRTNIKFIDITSLATESRFKAKIGQKVALPDGGTYIVDNAGVASHPGDEGMKKIAETIQQHLLF